MKATRVTFHLKPRRGLAFTKSLLNKYINIQIIYTRLWRIPIYWKMWVIFSVFSFQSIANIVEHSKESLEYSSIAKEILSKFQQTAVWSIIFIDEKWRILFLSLFFTLVDKQKQFY